MNRLRNKNLRPVTRFAVSLLSVILLLGFFSLCAMAAEVTGHGVTGLKAEYTDTSKNTSSYGAKPWEATSGTLTWSDTTVVTGTFIKTRYYKGTSLTLTNNSGSAQTLSFDYEVTLNGGTVSIVNGDTSTSISGKSDYSVPLENGGSITIETKTSTSAANTTTVKLSSIKLENENITVTFAAPVNGGYTVNDTENDTVIGANGETMTKPSTTVYTLAATPSDNYVFDGWYVGTELVSTDNPYSTSFLKAATVSVKFIVDPLYSVTTAIGGSKDELVVINSRYHHTNENRKIEEQYPTTKTSFYSVAAKKSNGDWDMQLMPDLQWAVSGSTININKTVTANGEYEQYAGTSWSYANMVSDVIRVYAKEDCLINFKFTNVVHVPDPDKRAGLPYLRVYKSTSGTETYDTLYEKAEKMQWENVTNEPVEYSLPKGHFLYIFTNGYSEEDDYAGLGYYATHTLSYNATISEFKVTRSQTKYTFASQFQDNLGNPLPGGILTIGDPTYTTDENGSVSGLEYIENTKLTLSINTVPNNYRFLGWSVNDSTELVCTPIYEHILTGNATVDPIFVPDYVTFDTEENTYQYLGIDGNPVVCDGEYVARNADATKFYATLADGFTDPENTSGVVALLSNMTIDGDFTIPEGKTLVVPNTMNTIGVSWDANTKQYNPHTVSVNADVYTLLTINNNLVIEQSGNLVVAGYQSPNGGSPTGTHGTLTVVGTVTVKDTAALYGYGLVNGNGTIYAKSGAKVHELCEILDMPHPAKMNSLVEDRGNYDIIPFNIIYVNTIEAKTVYHTGAKLSGHAAVRYDETTHIVADFIGTSDALFLMNGGTLTKYFCNESKQIIYKIDEDAEVSTGVFAIDMQIKFTVNYPVKFSSSDFVMPLSSGWQIKIAGKFNVNHNVKLLPGAKVDVEPTGVMTIASNANLIFYRLNDYDHRNNATTAKTAMGFCQAGYPVNMSRHGDFSIDNVGSAKLNVDGKIIANGGLYVTTQLVTEYSTDDASLAYQNYSYRDNGYNNLTGVGTIEMGSRTSPLKQIYENQKNDQNIYSVDACKVPIAAMKGLKPDADADVAGNYQTLTGTVYGYTNEYGINVWGTDPCVAGHHTDTQTSSAEEGFLECDGCGIPLARLVAIEASADAATELSLKFLIHSELDVTPKVSFRMVNLKEGDGYTVTNDEKDRYILTIPVASGEMTDQMTVSFTTGAGDAVKPVTIIEADGTSATQVSRSVLDYASLVLERGSDAQKALIRALVTYGGYAQTYFADQGKNVTTNPLAYSVLGTDAPTLTANWSAKHKVAGFGDVQFVSWDAVLDSAIYLRLRMSSTATDKSLDGYTFTLKYPYKNGNTVALLEKELEVYSHDTVEGDYYLDIAYIPAAFFDYPYVITVSDGKNAQQVVVRITDYLAGYLDNGNSGTKLAQAMYEYGKAAEKFFFPNGMTQPDIAE